MEVSAELVSVIAGGAAAAVSGIAKVFYDDRKEILGQLKDCTKQHAADQYVLGSQDSAIRFLSSKHSPETQQAVEDMLAAGQVKAEEAKSTVPTKGSR